MPKKTKQIIPAKKALETDKNYQNLLDELKSIIAQGQYQAYKAVDNIKVQTCWQLGERIVREELKNKNRADYGKYLIDSLAIDLKIPKRRLYEIVGFYRAYPIVRTVSAQLSWSHYLELSKIDNETHHIDLVLYHCGIPCKILVDLKVGKFSSRDVGQMNKYIGYWRRHKQYEHEQPTIGLIICREAGREEVIYALDGLEEKIFVARYKVKLPSEAKIKKALKNL
jgi:hypothetical protein